MISFVRFEKDYKNSDSTINIIVSGIQFLPTFRHRYGEQWSAYPKERQRLIDLILQNPKIKNPIIISGDVHFAEFLNLKCEFTLCVLE